LRGYILNLNSYLINISNVKSTGKVAQIIGPVVDVVFNGKDVELQKIYDSLEITKKEILIST
jgi:F0F1-type ATP synthase beta subunit